MYYLYFSKECEAEIDYLLNSTNLWQIVLFNNAQAIS